MLKALLVDDDIRDMEVLEMLLKKYCSEEIVITGHADNIDTAYRAILELKPDVIFLDIELGPQTGFDLLSRFTDFPFQIIFTTAYDQHAIKAIRFNALDYILKPVEIEELVNAVRRLQAAGKTSIDKELKNLVQHLSHPYHKTNRIAIPLQNGYKMIAVEEIMYCEARKEYTYIHCTNQAPVCSSTNLGEYETLLEDYSFCRVHHSFLVNREHVTQYIKGEGGELIVGKGISIPVSRRKKQDVLEWLTAKK
jgi:two-component system LytT family response regulator